MNDGTAPRLRQPPRHSAAASPPPPGRKPPLRPPRPPSPRLRHAWSTGALLVAFLMVASAAVAGVLVSYNTSSTTAFSLRAPPVTWSAGPDSSGNGYAASWSLSSNATYFSLTLKPVPEANITWGNLTSLTNGDTASYSVTVSGTSLASYSKILAARVEFYAYGTDALLGSLDLKQASPSVALGTLAAGASAYAKAYVKLDTGTGAQDLPASVSVSLSIA